MIVTWAPVLVPPRDVVRDARLRAYDGDEGRRRELYTIVAFPSTE